jgi:hypothetical protein
MSNANATKRIVIKNVRFSFLKVFKAAETLSGEKKFSTTILIPKDHPQINEIKAAIKEVRDARWGDKKVAGLRNPLRDGDDPNDSNFGREGYAGHYFLNASASEHYPPQCVDGALQPARASDWTSGDYGNVSVTFYAYDVKTNKGVGVGLGNVQFTRKGEPLAGGVSAAAEFSVEEALEPDEDF